VKDLACAWLGDLGPQQGVVLSTRIRLARNLEGCPFPCQAHPAALAETLARLVGRTHQLDDYNVVDMNCVHPLQAQLMVERHLISPAFACSQLPRALVLSPDSRLSLMINEEDHLRLQCLVPGLQFESAWQSAFQTEEFLAEELPFAFDEQFGYLTSCPSNVGTGLRASAMFHLPGLAFQQALESIVAQVSQLGLTVRGLYGEGSAAAGHLVQISNQVTLGPSEDEILAKMQAVCQQVLDYECSARQQLFHQRRLWLEDRCWRSWSILRAARLLESAEALEHLSLVRLGVDLKILPEVPLALLNEMVVRIRPAGLQMESGHELSPLERDAVRARLLRQILRETIES
jgi:protein arginine kinase